MIIIGFLGAQVFDDGTSTTWLNVWGWISTVFFIVLYVVGARAILGARKSLSDEAWKSLRNAGTVVVAALVAVWAVPGLLPRIGGDIEPRERPGPHRYRV